MIVASTILIADDHDDSRHYLERLLRRIGHVVRSAADAPAALALARHEVPHLFILDENMPGMSGLDLLAEIRSDPVLAGAKVIFLSGASEHAPARRAMEMGATDWLVKGVHGPDQILAAVVRALAPH